MLGPVSPSDGLARKVPGNAIEARLHMHVPAGGGCLLVLSRRLFCPDGGVLYVHSVTRTKKMFFLREGKRAPIFNPMEIRLELTKEGTAEAFSEQK